ncbi:DoxX family protein [Streptomyces sp. NPDC060275]|uniref:DoxX family protein n=1 Tax=Streptomyces sp. NPDC060275 TaxID=3347090 RepID=UPI003661D98D
MRPVSWPGLAVPVLGTAAAAGLTLYFVGAVCAHIRAGDPGVGGAVLFLLVAAGALAAGLVHHGPW